MDWTDVMAQRDELLGALEPHLGRGRARARANEIIQALVWGEGQPPAQLILQLLMRDLEGHDAHAMATAVLSRWVGFRDLPRPARPRFGPDDVHGPPRPRRETRLMGLWH